MEMFRRHIRRERGVSKGICVIHFEYVTALEWFKTGPRCRLLWTL